jgi:hypothetical protein
MVHFGIGWLYGYGSYYLFGSGSSGLGGMRHLSLGVVFRVQRKYELREKLVQLLFRDIRQFAG